MTTGGALDTQKLQSSRILGQVDTSQSPMKTPLSTQAGDSYYLGNSALKQCQACGQQLRTCSCKSPKQNEAQNLSNSLTGSKSQMKFTINRTETIATKQDKKQGTKSQQYTVYNIEIQTCINQWTLSYRYSELKKFHENLKRILKGNINVPKFPSKKIWKNKEKVISERRVQLQDYLNNLSKNVDLIQMEYACNFFKIDNYLRDYLSDLNVRTQGDSPQEEKEKSKTRNRSVFRSFIKNNSKNSNNKLESEGILQTNNEFEFDFLNESDSDDSYIGKYTKFTKSAVEIKHKNGAKQQNYPYGRISLNQKKNLSSSMIKFSSQVINKSVSKDPLDILSSSIDLITLQKQHKLTEEEVVLKFFKNVNNHVQQKDHYIRDFEEYYFKTRPQFQSKLIKLLLDGDMMIGVQGLLILMSEIDSSYVSSCTAIHLISKLLDFQKNIYAENFIKELIKIDPQNMRLYKFEQFLERQHSEGHRQSALHILQVYIERRIAFKNTLGSVAGNLKFNEEFDSQKISRTFQIKNETEQSLVKIIMRDDKLQQELLNIMKSKQINQQSLCCHNTALFISSSNEIDMKKQKSIPLQNKPKKINTSFVIQRKSQSSNNQSFNISLVESQNGVDLDLDLQLKSNFYAQLSQKEDSPTSDQKLNFIYEKVMNYDFESIFTDLNQNKQQYREQERVSSFKELQRQIIEENQTQQFVNLISNDQVQQNMIQILDAQENNLTLQNFEVHQKFISSLKNNKHQYRVLKYLDHQRQLMEIKLTQKSHTTQSPTSEIQNRKKSSSEKITSFQRQNITDQHMADQKDQVVDKNTTVSNNSTANNSSQDLKTHVYHQNQVVTKYVYFELRTESSNVYYLVSDLSVDKNHEQKTLKDSFNSSDISPQTQDRHSILCISRAINDENQQLENIESSSVHLNLYLKNFCFKIQGQSDAQLLEQSPSLSNSSGINTQLDQLIQGLQDSLASNQMDARGSDASIQTVALNLNKQISGQFEEEKLEDAGRKSYVSDFKTCHKLTPLHSNKNLQSSIGASPRSSFIDIDRFNVEDKASLTLLQILLGPLLAQQDYTSDVLQNEIITKSITKRQLNLCDQEISQSLIDQQLKETQFKMIEIL